MVKLLFLGYNGFANFGDDLLLFQAYKALINKAEVFIWTSQNYVDSSYLDQWFPQAKIVRTKKLGFFEFRKYDGVIYIGGGVFFDYLTNYPLGKFLKKGLSCFLNYNLAKLNGSRFAGVGIGLGPFLSERATRINKLRLSNFDFITVRDQTSFDIISEYDVDIRVSKGFDLSFYSAKLINVNKFISNTTNNILICPRKFSHTPGGDEYHDTLIRWCKRQANQGKNILVFGFQQKHDEPILEHYSGAGLKTKIWDPHLMEIDDVFEIFAQHELIISSRMHGIYVAGLLNIPAIGINVHPKVDDATKLFVKAKSIQVDFKIEDLESEVNTLGGKSELTNEITPYVRSAEIGYDALNLWVTKLNNPKG